MTSENDLSKDMYEVGLGLFKKFGPAKQVLKAIEELGELQVALIKDFSKAMETQKGDFEDYVIEEMADVEIMLSQMRMMVPDGVLEAKIREKLNRTKERYLCPKKDLSPLKSV